MSRTTSSSLRAAINASSTDEAFFVLLTIDHPALESPLRVCLNSVNIDSRGSTFYAYPFDIALPDDEASRPERARISIDNVYRDLVPGLRSMQTPATVLIEVILASDPDTVEASFPGFVLRNIEYNALTISGDLALDDLESEPYPADIFDPHRWPGIF